MLKVSAIACHHTGDLVKMYDHSIHKSFGVEFESMILTSTILDRKQYKSKVINCGPDMQLPASKRNFGAIAAAGKYLAFFDDDVEVDQNCLYEMAKYLDEHKKTGMVYAKLLNMEHRNRFDEAGSYLTKTGFLWSRAAQNIEDKGQYDHIEPILSGKSAACMIRSTVFFKVRQFDEDFGILGEETDLAWRVWLAGYNVMFIPKAVAYHAFNTKFKPRDKYYTDDRVYFNGCRNYITMLIKNLGTHNLWKILPIHIAIWIGASFAMILTFRFGAGWKILSGIWYVLRNLDLIRSKRRLVQKERLVDDRDIFPFILQQPHGGYFAQRFWRYISSKLHG